VLRHLFDRNAVNPVSEIKQKTLSSRLLNPFFSFPRLGPDGTFLIDTILLYCWGQDKGGQSTKALRCLEWVTDKGNGKLQRSFEPKAAKVSKGNVLRRSEIFIAPASLKPI
jgi:hypothetical protein